MKTLGLSGKWPGKKDADEVQEKEIKGGRCRRREGAETETRTCHVEERRKTRVREKTVKQPLRFILFYFITIMLYSHFQLLETPSF